MKNIREIIYSDDGVLNRFRNGDYTISDEEKNAILEFAKKVNFDVDLFEHPEKICKDARTYNEVANTLYRLLPNYSFDFSKRKDQDTTYMGLI